MGGSIFREVYMLNGINTTHSRNNKKTLTAIPMKVRRSAYDSLDDFLNKIPIATLNVYGKRVISGTRIC
jgi:hypothetical protein